MLQESAVYGFRLSPQQHRLWTLHQDLRRTPFRVWCLVVLEGQVRLPSLTRALAAVARRHEILRTRFQLLEELESPLQVVTEELAEIGEVCDLTDVAPEQQATEIAAFCARQAQLACDLDSGPPLGLSAVMLTAEKCVLRLELPAL